MWQRRACFLFWLYWLVLIKKIVIMWWRSRTVVKLTLSKTVFSRLFYIKKIESVSTSFLMMTVSSKFYKLIFCIISPTYSKLLFYDLTIIKFSQLIINNILTTLTPVDKSNTQQYRSTGWDNLIFTLNLEEKNDFQSR